MTGEQSIYQYPRRELKEKRQRVREVEKQLEEERLQLKAIEERRARIARLKGRKVIEPKRDVKTSRRNNTIMVGYNDWKNTRSRCGALWMFLKVNDWEIHVCRIVGSTKGGEHLYTVACAHLTEESFTDRVQCDKRTPEAKALNMRRIGERMGVVFKMKKAPRNARRRSQWKVLPTS